MRAGRAVPAPDAGLTVGLLGVGVVDTTWSVATLRELPEVFDQSNAQLHLPAYTATAVAEAAGWIASGALVAALVLAIGFAVPRLQAGRRSWWIPVVSAVIGWVAVFGIWSGAWLADPAVLARVLQTGA